MIYGPASLISQKNPLADAIDDLLRLTAIQAALEQTIPELEAEVTRLGTDVLVTNITLATALAAIDHLEDQNEAAEARIEELVDELSALIAQIGVHDTNGILGG